MRILILLSILFLTACETTRVVDTASLESKVPLSKDVQLPVGTPIAYYVDYEEVSSTLKIRTGYYNFYQPVGKNFKDALNLVLPDMFSNVDKLNHQSQFQYLFKYSAKPNYKHTWGTYSVDMELEVVTRAGQSLYKTTVSRSDTAGGAADPNAFYNVYAASIKESTIKALNYLQTNNYLSYTSQANKPALTKDDFQKLLGSIKPVQSGTGFFIDSTGRLATASHVIDECMYIDVQSKGVSKAASINKNSQLLDLAIVDSDFTNTPYAHFSASKPKATLGQQVFVTGFPLAGILAEYPSLTVGNVSSLGGLKGAKGYIQFSAPIQSGNSGGAVVGYDGSVVAVVVSTLNQSILLEQTGTTAQNVNFGIDQSIVKKYMDNNGVKYSLKDLSNGFEKSSKEAVDYTVQVLCYK